MKLQQRARVAVVAGVTGLAVALAPTAAQAWGGTKYLTASCWRGWLSTTATYGGDAGNYDALGYYFVRVDAYLKHNGSNVDFVREDQQAGGDGRANPRDTYKPVSGDRSWTVDAYAQDAPGHTANQLHDDCVIT